MVLPTAAIPALLLGEVMFPIIFHSFLVGSYISTQLMAWEPSKPPPTNSFPKRKMRCAKSREWGKKQTLNLLIKSVGHRNASSFCHVYLLNVTSTLQRLGYKWKKTDKTHIRTWNSGNWTGGGQHLAKVPFSQQSCVLSLYCHFTNETRQEEAGQLAKRRS